jgi:hypothetical protein
MARSLNVPPKSVILAYGTSAVAYALLAYGVFRLWRWVSLASIAFVWWQILATPQAFTRGALLLLIVTTILSTGVVASFKHQPNAGTLRDDAAS